MKPVKVISKTTGEIKMLSPSPRLGSLVDLGNWGGAFSGKKPKESNKVVTREPKGAAISGIYNSCYCKG